MRAHWARGIIGRDGGVFVTFRRSGVLVGLAALCASACLGSDRMTAAPEANERTISFFHIHTKETISVVYKRDGEYVPEAMKQINHIMRDWRKNEEIAIAPATIDLAWEMHEELGSKEPINIICGYRSRATNEMLRRTVGGQASQSQHITGKAIDITFPDIPLKLMRYSALIRERGGVGYYPTSGVPFVHVDTANVRMWPRMPRYELALVFPNGRSKYAPAGGGPITPGDVKVAQSKYQEVAAQVADFFRNRLVPGAARTMVASADKVTPAPAKQTTVTAEIGALKRNVSLTIEPIADPKPFAPARPQLAALATIEDPKPVSSAKTTARSTKSPAPVVALDRTKLNALVNVASTMPMHDLIAGPKAALRPQKALAAAALAEAGVEKKVIEPRVASLGSEVPVASTDPNYGLSNGWAPSAQFDEDHPDELSYRPFPLAPMLTETPSAHAPELAKMQQLDVEATLDMIGDNGGVPPLKLRPGRQQDEVKSAQHFQGKAVHIDALLEMDEKPAPVTAEASAR